MQIVGLAARQQSGARLWDVTAKERLLRQVLDLEEAEAARARIVITRDDQQGDIDEWGDLKAQTQALAEQAEARLAEREDTKSWR